MSLETFNETKLSRNYLTRDSFVLNSIVILIFFGFGMLNIYTKLIDQSLPGYVGFARFEYLFGNEILIGILLVVFFAVSLKAKGLDHRNMIPAVSPLLSLANIFYNLILLVLVATLFASISCGLGWFGINDRANMFKCLSYDMPLYVAMISTYWLILVKTILLVVHVKQNKKQRASNGSAV